METKVNPILTNGNPTGRTDSHGRQIRIGDIVRLTGSTDYADESGITDVIWNGEDLQIQCRTRENGTAYDHGLPLSFGGWESIEVIGNILDNPDLLV